MNSYFSIAVLLCLYGSSFAHTESRQQDKPMEQPTPQAIYIPYMPNPKPTESSVETANAHSFVSDFTSFLKQLWFFTKNLNYAWKFIFFTWVVSPTISRLRGIGDVVDFPADRIRDLCALLMRTFARAASTRDVFKLDTSVEKIHTTLGETNEKLTTYNTTATTGFEDLKTILVDQGKEIGGIHSAQRTVDESLQKNWSTMQSSITNFNAQLDDLKKMNDKFEQKFPTLDKTIDGLQQFLNTLNLSITDLSKNIEQAKQNRTQLEQKLDLHQKTIQETLQALHIELQTQKAQSAEIKTLLETAIKEKLDPVFLGMQQLTQTVKTNFQIDKK